VKQQAASTGQEGCETAENEQDGSVWESNPLTALFKPPTGFEDQGPHQRCKHSQPSGTFSVGAEQKCVKRGADAATGVRRGGPTRECGPLRPAGGRSVTRARLRVLGDCRASRVRPRTRRRR